MRYHGPVGYTHGTVARCGVLAVNLGTPSAPNTRALWRYLAEFLADPRVIELPRALWLPLLYGVIVPFRSPRSAAAYRKVWTAEGSPLMVESQRLVSSLGETLRQQGLDVEVRLAMRYGQPSVREALAAWRAQGLRRLLILPLYPQYSATTTASVFDAVFDALASWRWAPELRLIADYHAEPAWIEAVAASIRAHWAQHGRAQRLLFSFHGLPKRYLLAGDPYFCQCQASARRIAEALQLDEDAWSVAFQSRVGREEWLRPYTDETLRALPAQGVRTLDVVCPGFAVDCLETLEEIAMQNAEAFVAAGGERLRYIPALNDRPGHVEALVDLLARHGAGWPEFGPAEGRARLFQDAAEASRQYATYAGPNLPSPDGRGGGGEGPNEARRDGSTGPSPQPLSRRERGHSQRGPET